MHAYQRVLPAGYYHNVYIQFSRLYNPHVGAGPGTVVTMHHNQLFMNTGYPHQLVIDTVSSMVWYHDHDGDRVCCTEASEEAFRFHIHLPPILLL